MPGGKVSLYVKEGPLEALPQFLLGEILGDSFSDVSTVAFDVPASCGSDTTAANNGGSSPKAPNTSPSSAAVDAKRRRFSWPTALISILAAVMVVSSTTFYS